MSGNLFTDLVVGEKERVDCLFQGEHARIERILSQGHASPPGFWYDQGEAEWVCLLQGQARLRFREPDEIIKMKPGDWVWISARRPHRVDWTLPEGPTVWLGVFTGQAIHREDDGAP